MSHRIITVLIAFAAALSVPSADSRADGCVMSAILQNGNETQTLSAKRIYDNAALANLIRSYAPRIVEGYHLPRNYTSGYYTRRIEPYLAKPSYAPGADPEKLFRGMYLTPEELARILEKGHEVDKVTWTAGGPGISFSSSIEEAKSYIFHSADGRPGGIGVIFEVRKSDSMLPLKDAELNPTNTIFKSTKDLSPEQTSHVYLWGPWGAEGIESVIGSIRAGKLRPHQTWTNAFDFSR